MRPSVPLACHGLSRQFGRGRSAHVALHDISLAFSRGECTALLGPSGSGKTTLLSILGCLLAPSNGHVEMDGQRVDYHSQSLLCRIRRNRIGYIFQHAPLLPFLSVRENLEVCGRNAGLAPTSLRPRIQTSLDSLGILHHAGRAPAELSGGERQRVAVARALLHNPEILLADEPTGALDAENGRSTMQVLVDQARQRNAVLLTVTHDHRVMDLFDRIVRIDSGQVFL